VKSSTQREVPAERLEGGWGGPKGMRGEDVFTDNDAPITAHSVAAYDQR